MNSEYLLHVKSAPWLPQLMASMSASFPSTIGGLLIKSASGTSSGIKTRTRAISISIYSSISYALVLLVIQIKEHDSAKVTLLANSCSICQVMIYLYRSAYWDSSN